MSGKKVKSQRIVIDACVAHSASADGERPQGANCRRFLIAFRAVGHRLLMNAAMREEWKRHYSAFSLRWLASMESIGKVVTTDAVVKEEIVEAILELCVTDEVRTKFRNDIHLLHLSCTSDLRIASSDDKAKLHLWNSSAAFLKIRDLIWVNPATEDDLPEWLAAGAPAKGRYLRP